MKLFCYSCLKPCKDEAVKFGDNYYHVQCFTCKECGMQLSTSDFYTKNEDLYCQSDHRHLFGSKCKSCREYIEGDVVTALSFVFHKNCFVCSSCSKVLEAGNKVTFIKTNFLCNDCLDDNSVPEPKKLAVAEREVELKEQADVGKEPIAKINQVGQDPPQTGYGRFYNTSYLECKMSPIKKGPSINTSENSPKHYHRPENFSYTQVKKDFIKPPKRESSILLNDLDSEIALISRTLRMAPNGMIGIAPTSNREPVRLAKLPDAHLKVKQETKSEFGYKLSSSIKDDHGIISSEKKDREKYHSDGEQYGGGGDSDYTGNEEDGDDGAKGATGFDKAFHLDPLTGLRRLRSNPASTIYGTLGSMRSSLLDILKKDEPIKIYPYEELIFSNFGLPFGVERSSVERHLSMEEFMRLFRMTHKEFYTLAEWKRNDLKRRLDLF